MAASKWDPCSIGTYAPPGYELLSSHYADGSVVHTFACEGKPELTCTVGAHESEQEKLDAFREEHSEPVTKPGKRKAL